MESQKTGNTLKKITEVLCVLAGTSLFGYIFTRADETLFGKVATLNLTQEENADLRRTGFKLVQPADDNYKRQN